MLISQRKREVLLIGLKTCSRLAQQASPFARFLAKLQLLASRWHCSSFSSQQCHKSALKAPNGEIKGKTIKMNKAHS